MIAEFLMSHLQALLTTAECISGEGPLDPPALHPGFRRDLPRVRVDSHLLVSLWNILFCGVALLSP